MQLCLVVLTAALFGSGDVAVFNAAAAAATFAPTGGAGSGFCAIATGTGVGFDFGANYDDIYACGPIPPTAGEAGYDDPPFESSPYGFQCTELANRYLGYREGFTLDDESPGSGGSLVGGNFVTTAHATAASHGVTLAIGASGSTVLPTAGDIISMWGGSNGQGPSGDDTHVAVVTGSPSGNASSGWQIPVMSENDPSSSLGGPVTPTTDGNAYVSVSGNGASWTYNGDFYTSFDWLEIGPATPAHPPSSTATGSTCSPQISSVSRIAPRADQTIVIRGTCLGSEVPYVAEDSPLIQISDLSTNWNACYSRNDPPDQVTCSATTWSPNRIVIHDLSGAYGDSGWVIQKGDSIRVKIWNAVKGRPGIYKTTSS